MFHEDLPKQIAYLESVLVKSQTLAQVLKKAPALDLPNWYVGAGAIAQTVWNELQGYPFDHGVKEGKIWQGDPTVSFNRRCDQHLANDRHVCRREV